MSLTECKNWSLVKPLCVCVRVRALSCLVVSSSLQHHGATRFLCPWDSPGKNTGVGYHSLLQEIFPTQVSNPGLPTFQEDSLLSEPPGKP